jgi:hypothetical protein
VGTLSASLVELAAAGDVDLYQDGTFVYTANENYAKGDTLTYVANDGCKDSVVTTVRISTPRGGCASAKQTEAPSQALRDLTFPMLLIGSLGMLFRRRRS